MKIDSSNKVVVQQNFIKVIPPILLSCYPVILLSNLMCCCSSVELPVCC